jgi:Zn-dependent M28 family amino/carboxypeptidase
MVCKSMTMMPGRSFSTSLPPMTDEESTIREQLERSVNLLAGAIGERHLWRFAALTAAADYIKDTLQAHGYTVITQAYETQGKTVSNIETELTGATLPKEIVLLGAHYDSVVGSPGANDNASGTAAVLAIAHLLAGKTLARSVRFVAFVNEESPFFQTRAMGSHIYAHRARERGEHIVAMLSLETIGYYSDAKGSQSYPPPFSLWYPDTGNFIAFVGDLSAHPLVQRCIESFRSHTSFPSEGVAAPGWMTGISWSDHWSFSKEGYPAIMLTDTALFRDPHYHRPTDTPEKLDFTRTARVVAGVARVTVDLAGSIQEK